MKTTGQITSVSVNFKNSKGKITLDIDTKNVETLNLLNDLKQKEKKLDIEIKQHREKRSLNANAYFWKLLNEICEYQDVDPIEDYKRRVEELGYFNISTIPEEDFYLWKEAWESRGIAWKIEKLDTEIINNEEICTVVLYKGSSTFNTKQMAKLIDDLVQDCKAVGIETKPQAEIYSLLKEWEEEHKNGKEYLLNLF